MNLNPKVVVATLVAILAAAGIVGYQYLAPKTAPKPANLEELRAKFDPGRSPEAKARMDAANAPRRPPMGGGGGPGGMPGAMPGQNAPGGMPGGMPGMPGGGPR